MVGWWLWLVACDGLPRPAELLEPPGPSCPAAPRLEVLEGWLRAMGYDPERIGDVLRIVHPAPDGPVGVTVQIFEDRAVVYLATQGLISLDDATDQRGLVLLLTNLATLNYETAEGKLQLNPRSGEVLFSVELETDDGLGQQTFQEGIGAVVAGIDTLRPQLRRAATP